MASKHHINPIIAPKAKITAAEFGAKFNSKREVFRFLSAECHVYLPSYESVTIWHLKDIAAKKKHAIKCEEVKVLHVPQFDGLSIEDMLNWGRTKPDVMRSLPPESEIEKLPRQYIINVIYTLVGEPFSKWVDGRVNARNEKILNEQDLLIEMDPELAGIFRQSTSMSLTKGTASHLMKMSSKRRRPRKQIQEEKRQEKIQKLEVERKIQQYDQLEAQLAGMQEKIRIAEDVKGQVNSLIGQGLMKCNDLGQVSVIQDPNETEQLLSVASKSKYGGQQSQHDQGLDDGQSFASLNPNQLDEGEQYQEAMDQQQ